MSSRAQKSKFAELGIKSSSRSPDNHILRKVKEIKVFQKLDTDLNNKRKTKEEIIRISLARFKENKGLRLNTVESQNMSGDNADDFRLKGKRFSLYPLNNNVKREPAEKQPGSPKNQTFLTGIMQARSVKNLTRIQIPSLKDNELLSNKLLEIRKAPDVSARAQSPLKFIGGNMPGQFRLHSISPKNSGLRSPNSKMYYVKPPRQKPQSSLSNLLNFNDYFSCRTKNADASPKCKKLLSISQKSRISFGKKSTKHLNNFGITESLIPNLKKGPSVINASDCKFSPVASSKTTTDYMEVMEDTELSIRYEIRIKPDRTDAQRTIKNNRLPSNGAKKVSAKRFDVNKTTFSRFSKRDIDFSSYYAILDRISVNPKNKLENKPSLLREDSRKIVDQSNVSIQPALANSQTEVDESADLTGILKSKKSNLSSFLSFPISECPFRHSKICPIALKPPYSYQYDKRGDYASYWMDCINKLHLNPNIIEVECTFYSGCQSSIESLPSSNDPYHPVLSMLIKLAMDINREHNNFSSIHL